MVDATIDLLKAHFRQLRLPTMSQEFEKLADAAATNQHYFQFLLRLTELELGTRAANAIATRIKNADFPVLKDFDTFDFSALPTTFQAEGAGVGAVSGLSINIIVALWAARELEKLTSPSPWAKLLAGRVSVFASSRRRSW